MPPATHSVTGYVFWLHDIYIFQSVIGFINSPNIGALIIRRVVIIIIIIIIRSMQLFQRSGVE